MTNIVLSLILCQLIPIVIADQKCYTNQTFFTGEPEICINESPFCCFDISGEYYCCEENQTLTIIRSTTIVFGIIVLLTFIIVTICFVFIDFEKLTEATVEVMVTPPEDKLTSDKFDNKTERTVTTTTDDDGFSVLFKPQTAPDKETVVTEEKTEKTETKPKPQDNYKPDWGQPGQKVESKSSATKIGFKPKRPSTVKSVEKLKDSITKSRSKSSKSSSKTGSKKSYNKNVEKLTKTLNK